ncbi:GATA zinc finger domain-containing protein 10-like [Impatiens glandulifera]|uniref:GATA zinc finger domain-containing protein 10-like n=1 Tax=Impatiens glandulifera TaxID=253017 RepID=UPI001FB1060C|nr:GATA zinc finger domain-containing protein 10-like [Impatiens glandulifera]
MEEAKAMAQQQQLMLQQQQRQQLLIYQQIQQQQKQRQQQQQQAISRFPSNIDAHLRPPGLLQQRPLIPLHHQQQQHHQQHQSPIASPSLSPIPNQHLQQQQQFHQNHHHQHQIPNPNLQQQQHHQQQQQHHQSPNPNFHHLQQQLQQQQQQQQNQKPNRSPSNSIELQMSYQDAWRVCHPDFKTPFSSLEDACDRLLPYHAVADYEAEEDDRILDSDSMGQVMSRSQQWDLNIAAKVAEFTATFEKQVMAFNIISRKWAVGEFRSEERLMVEQALFQEERRAAMDLRTEMEAREKAKMQMAVEQARAVAEPPPVRLNAFGAHGMSVEDGVSPNEMVNNNNGWGEVNAQRDDQREPSEDFLNDEETDNGQNDWRDEGGEFDLNAR